jgi:hypothetical protein
MPFSSYLSVEWSPSTAPFAAESWVDITSKVRTIRTSAGARSIEDVFGAGTCTLEVNNQLRTIAAWLDMNTWYRYRRLRVSTATATLFDGWVKSIVHDPNITPGVSFATIDCIDAVGLIAEAAGDADFESWWGSPPDKTIDGQAGYINEFVVREVVDWVCSTVGAVTPTYAGMSRAPMFIAAKQTGSGLRLLQDYLEAERGQLAADGTTVNVYGRYMPFTLAAGSATAAFSDTGTYRYRDLVLAAPDEAYYDTAVIGIKGSDEPQRTADVPTDYPPSTYTRTTQSPLTDANWAKANADLIVNIGKQTDTYPRQITSHVAGPTATSVDTSHPALLATVPGADALDVTYAGSTYTLRVTAIEHRVSVDEGWWVTFGFSSLDRFAAAYGAVDVFQLNTSALGGPDILGP